jgi:phosphotriesterase-related protein
MAIAAAEMILSEGANPNQVMMGHVDVTKDYGIISAICKLGVNVSLDKFGRETSDSDKDRVDIVKRLIDDGFISRIFVCSDMGNPVYLKNYGGSPGLDYICTTIVPNLLKKGLSTEHVHQIFTENPNKIFCFLT